MVSLISTHALAHVHKNVADSFKSGHIHIHLKEEVIEQVQRSHMLHMYRRPWFKKIKFYIA